MKLTKRGLASRRSQETASSATTLLPIIGLIIIMYVLFLPPEDRELLLSSSGDDGRIGTSAAYNGQGPAEQVLWNHNVGDLPFLDADEVEHRLPSITVRTSTQGEALKSMQSVQMKTTAFGKEVANLSILIDPDNTDRVLLSFNVAHAAGRMKIKFNDHLVADSRFARGSVPPIEIPRDFLQKSNSLVFESEEVGFSFWKMHSAELSNVLLTADVKDVSEAEGNLRFTVGASEHAAADRFLLRFIPECSKSLHMEIALNYKLLFSGVPTCAALNQFEIPVDDVKLGENVIQFSLDDGAMLIDQVLVKALIGTSTSPSYFFNIGPNAVRDLSSGFADVFAVIRFSDASSRKAGIVNVNGYLESFDTTDAMVVVPVTPYVAGGTNSIMFSPQVSDITIVEAMVVLQ